MTVWLREEYKNITLYRLRQQQHNVKQCWCFITDGVAAVSSWKAAETHSWGHPLNVKLLTIWTPDKCTCYSNSAVDVFVCCPLLANSEWWITPDPPNQFRTEALKLAHTHASGPDGSSCCCALCDLLVLSSYGETAVISNFSSRI